MSYTKVKVKVKVTLRPTVSRPVRPGVRPPSRTGDQLFLYLVDYVFYSFGFVDVGVPFLTRSRICTFQFLPGIARAAFLRPESHRNQEHSLLSLFSRLPNQQIQVLVFITPRNRVAQLSNRALSLCILIECKHYLHRQIFLLFLYGIELLWSICNIKFPFSSYLYLILY
jgi:hypothetical protein